MASRSWLVDSSRIASKIKSASENFNSQKAAWKSNPSRACPNCHHVIDNSEVANDWPGLPKGVKFDPSDPEIIWHLLAKAGIGNLKPHPFIDEFIPTVDEDDGICYTHPKNLPGVKQDGSMSHFFHRAIKAYNTGTRKRRKIHDDDIGDVRWHKTGRTKPVSLDGVQKGCKKIMVLYGGKSQKTNWVMHQYHLGTGEDEKEGEYVVSKIFYQQQQAKQGDKLEQDLPEPVSVMTPNVCPVTPKSATPELCVPERQTYSSNLGQESVAVHMNSDADFLDNEAEPKGALPGCDGEAELESHENQMAADCDEDHNENHAEEDLKWWDSGSQCLLDSQQLVEALSLCDDLLQSQSPNREEGANIGASISKPRLADYAELGKESFKRDLEECQNMDPDHPSNIDIDTPPDFRLSQLEFESQESFLAWGTGKTFD